MDRLRNAITNGTAILVIGSGFAAATTAGAPTATWLGLIRSGAERARRLGREESWSELVDASLTYGITNDDPDSLIRAASMVSGALRAPGMQSFSDWLKDDIGGLSIAHRDLAESIGDLHLSILTTNYDHLLESTLGRPPASWTEPDQMQALLLGNSSAIGHLHGVWDAPMSVIFSEADYARLLGSPAAQAIQQAVSTIKSMIYVGFGAGLDDPNFAKLLEWHRTTFQRSGAEHFRLCLDADLLSLERTHAGDNITPVAYGTEFSALPDFLRSLAPESGLLVLSPSGIVRDSAADAQAALSQELVADSIIAETLQDATLSMERALLRPVLLPVPNAEFVRSRARNDKSRRLERVDPIQDASEAEYVLVVGDDESGVTTTIKWMALAAAQHLGNVAPLYINFRDCKRIATPLEDRIRHAAREMGVLTAGEDSIPAHVLAIDDLNANVPRISARVLEGIADAEAFSVIMGCKSGHEDDIIENLRGLGVMPRVRYVGRLRDSDVRQLAKAVSPTNHESLTGLVIKVLRTENLPRTPLSVSLLISILLHGGRIASSASQTMILDQYVSTLLGRGNPHEDARYDVDQQGREALLAGLAEAYVDRGSSGLSESDVVSILEGTLERMGWTESPTGILRGLIDRRVLRRSGASIVFGRNSYLYLFAAKRSAAKLTFLDHLLSQPLYYSAILKDYAALVRRDGEVLRRLRSLILDRQAVAGQKSPFEVLPPVDPPEIDASSTTHVDRVGGKGSASDLASQRLDEVSADDEMHAAFPAEDPAEMSFAMRLLRALDLVSTVLRDSDQVEDLPLKTEVLREALAGWGVAVEALTDDPDFQEFIKTLVEDVGSLLALDSLEEERRKEVLEDFLRILPAAMSLGGVGATLSSRKLIVAYESLLQQGLLDATNEVALGAVSFAYSLHEPGWPAKVAHLLRNRGNQWIGRNFFFYLFYEEYVHDREAIDDQEALLELCVHLAVAPLRFGSDAERIKYADRVRADFRSRRLQVLGRDKAES